MIDKLIAEFGAIEDENSTKTRLVKAALEILENEGIAGFTLRKVASKAGITVSSIYNHFKSKQELLTHLIVFSFVEVIYSAVVESLVESGDNLPQKLKNFPVVFFKKIREKAQFHDFKTQTAVLELKYWLVKFEEGKELYRKLHEKLSELLTQRLPLEYEKAEALLATVIGMAEALLFKTFFQNYSGSDSASTTKSFPLSVDNSKVVLHCEKFLQTIGEIL